MSDVHDVSPEGGTVTGGEKKWFNVATARQSVTATGESQTL